MKVYEYGLYRPRDEARCAEILRTANRYYNTLIEIERDRREAISAAQRGLVPKIASAQAAIDALVSQLEATRAEIQASRQRSAVHRRADGDRAKALKAKLKGARAALKEARAEAREDPALLSAYAETRERSHSRRLAARAACGLYWGTYLCVEAAADAACKSAAPPRFRRWDGGGTLAAQVQKGIAADELFGADTRVQIDPAPWAPLTPGGKRPQLRSRFRLRVGSEGRAPVWAEWGIIMHRPLPADARIMWAKVIARREGRKIRWVLQLSVQTAPAKMGPEDRVVGLDLGWRLRPDGAIRVAYWHDGTTGAELTVPACVPELHRKAESVRGFRDRDLDALKATLELSSAPESVRERGATMHAWRSHGRFHALHALWKSSRADGDTETYSVLDDWHKRDEHLERYERGLRTQAIRHRREVYRLFVADLSRRYGTVVVEDWDLRSVIKHPAPEDGVKVTTEADHHRVMVAPHTLRQMLESRMRCVKVDPAGTTLDHHATGVRTEDDPARTVVLDYGETTEDQDLNAALSILARGQAVVQTQGPLAYYNLAKRDRPARFAKRHKPKGGDAGEGCSQPITQDSEITE